jgi:broad specificity phosphatase PhoE
MNRIYLIRHGENRANLTKELSHRKIDYPLNAKGRLQAQQTAAYFQNRQVDEIYASPLCRAVQTAQIIAQAVGLRYTVMENFREINVGDLEGQPVSAELWARHNQVLEGWLDGHPGARFPGGENYFELRDRMLRGLLWAVQGKSGRSLLIVAHGGIFTLTIKDLCPQVNMQAILHKESANCSISEILLHENRGKIYGELISWSSFSHLQGKAAELVSGVPQPGELDELTTEDESLR